MFTTVGERQEMVERMEALLSGDSDLSTQGVPTDESEIYVDLKESLEAVEMPLEIYRLYLKQRVAEFGRRAISSPTAGYSHLAAVETEIRLALGFLDQGFGEIRNEIVSMLGRVEQVAWEEVDTLEARLME